MDYDEFGNYIGPEILSDDEEDEQRMVSEASRKERKEKKSKKSKLRLSYVV